MSRFLGHFQPQEGGRDIWELDSDQHYFVGRNGESYAGDNGRYNGQSCGVIPLTFLFFID